MERLNCSKSREMAAARQAFAGVPKYSWELLEKGRQLLTDMMLNIREMPETASEIITVIDGEVSGYAGALEELDRRTEELLQNPHPLE